LRKKEVKMILKIQRNMRKVALILAFFMLMMSSDYVLLNAEEEEFRSCEEALKLCVGGSFIFVLLNPVNALVCLAGYGFCKKYVEKHLKK